MATIIHDRNARLGSHFISIESGFGDGLLTWTRGNGGRSDGGRHSSGASEASHSPSPARSDPVPSPTIPSVGEYNTFHLTTHPTDGRTAPPGVSVLPSDYRDQEGGKEGDVQSVRSWVGSLRSVGGVFGGGKKGKDAGWTGWFGGRKREEMDFGAPDPIHRSK
ncbi:hypothetical protein QFC20_005184 [Naganishia adeliensis]|uniref:Uncharacterized protein n=1 Tax=Naganishia adeliensis TaxID=92952 RepID=A0ACC2VSP0_9TREE|nr:hypothetical protein QFC20_005184 [Naganishia adeliensis]